MKSKLSNLIKEIPVYALLLGILYLFYRSIWVLAALPLIVLGYRRLTKETKEEKRKATLSIQFKDMLISLSAALRAGYSMENALKEAYKELEGMYGIDGIIVKKTREMLNRISLGVPLEEVFNEFAEESGVEEIATFAQIFSIARRSGGNMVEIIQKTSTDIAAKVDTKNEIRVLISSKRLEQTILLLMPPAMIVYISLAGGGMLDPLYGNIKGVVIMSICLAVYVAAFFIARKITDIKV